MIRRAICATAFLFFALFQHCFAQDTALRQRLIDNALFAIISTNDSLPDIGLMKEGEMITGTFYKPVDGTCFFITPNLFVTAYHVLNKAMKRNVHLMLNNAGHVISEFSVVAEYPDMDLTIGSVKETCMYFNRADSGYVDTAKSLMAYGFPSDSNLKVSINFKMVKGKLVPVGHSGLSQAHIQSQEVDVRFIEQMNSTDLTPVQLRNTHVIVTKPGLPKGCSGGPLIDEATMSVMGFASMGAKGSPAPYVDIPLQIAIPVDDKRIEKEVRSRLNNVQD